MKTPRSHHKTTKTTRVQAAKRPAVSSRDWRAETLAFARRPESLQLAAIALLAILVYLPVVHGGTIWDDDTFVFKNYLVRMRDGLWHIWFTTEPVDYLPLTLSSFWLEWRLWGNSPAGYHLTNILLHAMNAGLFYGLLRRMKLQGAFWAALLFAVHPVNVASVAWITERKNTLSMLFFLLSLNFYVAHENNQRWGMYGLALGAFLLALLSKSSTVVLPPALLLYLWWRHGRLHQRDLLECLPFFGLALMAGLAGMYFQGRGTRGISALAADWPSRLAATGWIVWFYLYHSFIPLHLAMVYPRWSVNGASLLAWTPLVALLVLFVLFWRGKMRGTLFALGYFVVALGPVLGLIPMGYQNFSLVADHLQQLALLGPIALLGAALSQHVTLASRWAKAGLLAVFFVLSFRLSATYQNSETLWKHNLAQYPHLWCPYDQLGAYYTDKNEFQQALDCYDAAQRQNDPGLSLPGNQAMLCDGRATALAQQNRLDEALAASNQAVALSPNDISYLSNRAQIYYVRQQYPPMIADLTRVLRISPFDLNSLNLRGSAYTLENQTALAFADFDRAIQLFPDDAMAYNNRAELDENLGRLQDCQRDLQRAIEADPAFGIAYANRAECDMKVHDFAAAWRDAQSAEANGAAVSPEVMQALKQWKSAQKIKRF